MTVLTRGMNSILKQQNSAVKMQETLASGHIARVQGADGKTYIVFTSEQAKSIKPKK
jgi:hypothetical protein